VVKSVITIAIVLAILAAIYAVLQYFWPSIRGQKFYRPGFFTDLGYWFLSPLLNRGFSQIVVIAALIPLALALGIPMQQLAEGWGPVGAQPLWLQAIGIIVIGDFIGYWVHRYTHQGWWWRVHAVHHSSPQLDWLAAARVHPFNDALAALARRAGLSRAQVESCLKDEKIVAQIRDSREEASNVLLVRSTPTMFVNGEKVEGAAAYADFEAKFKAILEKKPN